MKKSLSTYGNTNYLRWLALFVFILGYGLTARYYQEIHIEYFVYNAIAFFSCAVLLLRVKEFNSRNSAIWMVIVTILVVYFIRFYWIVIEPLPVKIMLHTTAYAIVQNKMALFNGFKMAVLFFAATCISISVLHYINSFKERSAKEITGREAYWQSAKSLLLVIPIIMLVLGYLAYNYHIGEMGSKVAEPLPFRLNGVIFYSRLVVIPLLLLLLIYLADASKHLIVSRIGLLLLLGHGISDMLIRNSRSGLLLCVLLVLFLMVVGGIRFYRREKVFLGLALISAMLMIPFITQYRYHRTIGDAPTVDAMNSAIGAVFNGGYTSLLSGFEFVFFRIPGIEAIVSILGLGAKPLGMESLSILGQGNGMAGYVTNVVYQIPETSVTLAAPSYLGWFYIVGGVPLVVIGAILVSIFAVTLWSWLKKLDLMCSPVVQVFFLWMIFIAITEGTIDSMLYMIIVGIACITGCELVMKRIFKNSSKNLTLA